MIIDTFLSYFKKYLYSFLQSTVFTGRVVRQTNRLYVLRMIVKLELQKWKTILHLSNTL